MSKPLKPGVSSDSGSQYIPGATDPLSPSPLSRTRQPGPAPRLSNRFHQIGATALEYTMILALASVIAFGGFQLMGGSLGSLMDTTSSAIAGSPS